jgi:signal transduction histidine kinase
MNSPLDNPISSRATDPMTGRGGDVAPRLTAIVVGVVSVACVVVGIATALATHHFLADSSTDGSMDAQGSILLAQAVIAVVTLVVAALVGLFLLRRQVRSMRHAVEEEAHDLSEQQIRRFVSDASHELRTPLAAIRGYAELAQSYPDHTATALERVDAASMRMTSMIDNLLLLARLDAGGPLAYATVDLPTLLGGEVEVARRAHPGHRFRIEESAATGTVTGDPERLQQAAAQLLANAGANTPEGTTVTVRLRPDGFDVHDDGPGLPPDVAAHAFERFARDQRSRARPHGAGLGLALVDAIVEAHGGRVILESRPGDTTFSVRLPVG